MTEIVPWCQKLTAAVQAWCKRNGYKHFTQLRDELEISDKMWQQIMGRRSFVDTEFYAKIFVRTNLAEADPRKVPPRKRYIPRTNKTRNEPRAWTETEFQDWKKSQTDNSGKKPPARRSSPPEPGIPRPRPPGEIPQAPPGDALMGLLRPVLQLLALELRPMLSEEVEQAVERHMGQATGRKLEPGVFSKAQNREFGELCRTLHRALMTVKAGTKTQRTAFSDRNGQRLADLLPLVEGFSLPDEAKREQFLNSIQEIDMGKVR